VTAIRRTGVAAPAWLAIVAGLGCGRQEAPPAERTGDDRPAAAVAGRPVPVAWVRAAAERGLGVESALREAVTVAALGHLARRDGLDRSAAFRDETRSLLVRRLLARQVEVADPPSDRDRQDLERLYRERETFFVHPEIRTVRHLVVVLVEPDRTGRRPPMVAPDPEWEAGRRATADLAPLAVRIDDAEAFDALRPILEHRFREFRRAAGLDPDAKVDVRSERIGPFDREGAYDPAFVEAVFRLPFAGAVSEPVKTAFGWHLIRLEDVQAPRAVSFEEAIPELVQRGGTLLAQRRMFDLLTEARARYRARAHPERLEALFRHEETVP
jgi:hypothetical protein